MSCCQKQAILQRRFSSMQHAPQKYATWRHLHCSHTQCLAIPICFICTLYAPSSRCRVHHNIDGCYRIDVLSTGNLFLHPLGPFPGFCHRRSSFLCPPQGNLFHLWDVASTIHVVGCASLHATNAKATMNVPCTCFTLLLASSSCAASTWSHFSS